MTVEYSPQRLRRDALPPDPLALFAVWREGAGQTEPWGGAAMVLSTVSHEGLPSSRVVLLRGVDGGGFQFFTNHESRKGGELDVNPACSLVFWWPSQVRQVRVDGVASRLPAAASDAYFSSRSRASRIGAWASPQSKVIDSRAELESLFLAAEVRFTDRDVPRPPYWGGYRVVPRRIEFWQGGEARLHDRFCYTRAGDGGNAWIITRLAP